MRPRLKTPYVPARANSVETLQNMMNENTVRFHSTRLGAVQKSISSRIAEFGRYGGRGFITNPLSVTEWNLTMFSIIFYKVSSLDTVK